MPKYINASQAHKILIRKGFNLSYPTAIKWLRDNGLTNQIGPYGTISVDLEMMDRCLSLLTKAKENNKKAKRSNFWLPSRKSPGRKKQNEQNAEGENKTASSTSVGKE